MLLHLLEAQGTALISIQTRQKFGGIIGNGSRYGVGLPLLKQQGRFGRVFPFQFNIRVASQLADPSLSHFT